MEHERAPGRPSAKFHRLWNDHLAAFWNDVEKGGQMPEDWPEIEAALEKAHARLFAYVCEIEAKAQTACGIRPQ
jgi:hypothetical protein